MVEKKDNNRGRAPGKRYNTRSSRGNNNSSSRYKTDRAPEFRSLFRFLFSVNGKISRDLFFGIAFLIHFAMIVFYGIRNAIVTPENYVMTQHALTPGLILTFVFLIAVLWIMIANGYKRAHALGISGFYSLAGLTICKPFFFFNRQDSEYVSENIKNFKGNFLRSIGRFFNKSIWHKLGYFLLTYSVSLSFIFMYNKSVVSQGVTSDNANFVYVTILFVINLVQLFLSYNRRFQRIYQSFTKVVSFLVYNAVVIFATFFVTVMYIYMSFMGMFSGRNAMPKTNIQKAGQEMAIPVNGNSSKVGIKKQPVMQKKVITKPAAKVGNVVKK